MTELEQSVLAFVAEETRARRKRLSLSSRLSQDIGVDGDDAVELFQKFEEKYEVDLALLYDHWNEHFMAEGGGFSAGMMVGAGMAVLGGDLLYRAFPSLPSWAWAIALMVVYLLVHAKFFYEPPSESDPITLQQLVDAAASRKWARKYDRKSTMFRLAQ